MSMPVMTFFPSVAASSTASQCSTASIGATLAQPPAMGGDGEVDRLVARVLACQALEQTGVVVEPERGPRLVELCLPEQCGRRGPDRLVPGDRLDPQVRAESDQLGEVV